ncbi:MAG TPA: glycosyltransferase [Terracidiphilus sp.]|nr:glycosyltransferase [Terracidiphilus sp.]
MGRIKVLAIAYACNPNKGSESGVGWGWVNAIAKEHDVTVLTADFNANDIHLHQRSHQSDHVGNPQFIYLRNRPWHYRPEGLWLRIENSPAKPIMNLAYQNWLQCAYAEARRELVRNRYDLVHLITYVGWRFPGRFYQLDVPFVWGPIGGLKNTPWNLFPALGLKGAFYYGGRNLINSAQIKLLPGPKRALKKAGGAVIAATSEIQQSLFEHFGSASRVICEVGLPEVGPTQPHPRAAGEPLRIAWSGLHLPGKALQLLLRAAASLPLQVDYQIEILGDGPLNREWRALAQQLKIGERCHWLGRLPRDGALAVMKSCHVLAITSLKELTSTVAVEAIALGLPVICLDHCGLADLVTEDCGVKVHPGSQAQIVRDFARAIETLFCNEPLRRSLAQGALLRSHEYSWQRKLDRLNEVYGQALQLEHQCGTKRLVEKARHARNTTSPEISQNS